MTETYMIYMQDYDYCGVSMVEGPAGTDMQKLKTEYWDEWRTAYKSHEEAKLKAREGKLPEPPTPEWLYRGVSCCLAEFQDSQTYGFACWLVDNKGFKHVNVNRVSM